VSSRFQRTARRIVQDLQAFAGGDISRWVMVYSIARRLELRDHDLIDRAIVYAHECGWIEIQGLDSVKLTDAGQRLLVRMPKR
jgi:hypothetical protein